MTILAFRKASRDRAIIPDRLDSRNMWFASWKSALRNSSFGAIELYMWNDFQLTTWNVYLRLDEMESQLDVRVSQPHVLDPTSIRKSRRCLREPVSGLGEFGRNEAMAICDDTMR